MLVEPHYVRYDRKKTVAFIITLAILGARYSKTRLERAALELRSSR